MGVTWNEALPDNDTTANEIDDYHRDLMSNIRSRMAREHIWSASQTATNEGGHHNFVTLQVQTSAPVMAGTTGGALWVKSSDKGIYITDSAGTDYLVVASAKGISVIPAATGTQGGIPICSSANGGGLVLLAGSADGLPLVTHSGTAAPDWVKIDHGAACTGLSDNDHTLYVRGQTTSHKTDSGTTATNDGSVTTINFSFTFSAAPKVVICPAMRASGDHWECDVESVSTASFVVYTRNLTSVNWIAIGAAA